MQFGDGFCRSAERGKYMFMSPHQNAGQNYNIKTAKTLFQTVTEFSYSNDIYDKFNSDLNFGNA
jgi:hypothetical protein